jgi:hypothetical protein
MLPPSSWRFDDWRFPVPVLRLQQDNSLAETLGNLGQSLANNFNPLSRLQAYQIQQRVWLEQEQLREQQRQNAARQAAIGQWGHIVPADKLPQIANMIYQNAPYDQVAKAAAQLSGNLVDDPSPAGLAKNIRYIEQITGKPYDYQSLGPPVAGALTAKAANDWKVDQAGKTAGATALGQKTGEQAAVAPLLSQLKDDTSPEATAGNIKIMETINGRPWDQPYAPVVGPNTQQARDRSDATRAGQQATATSQGTKVGEKAANAPFFGGLVDDPSPTGTATNIKMIEQITGQPYDVSKGPPIAGPLTLKSNQDWMINNEREKSKATATGTSEVTGVDPTKPLIANPLIQPPTPTTAPPTTSPPTTAPATTAAPVPVAAPPAQVTRSGVPQGATSDPNRPGWYWQGGQLHPAVTTGGPTGTVFGTQPGDLDVAKGENEKAAETLTGAYSAGGEMAVKLKTITAQIRALEQVSRTGGAYGQFTAGPLRDLLDKAGLANVTNAQQAQTAEMNLLKNELPSAIKNANMTRVAQPEIAAVGTMTGTADLPPGVLDNILANVDNGVDYTLKRKELAGRALGYGAPLNYPDFQQQDTSLLNDYQANADKRRQSYGAINTTPPAAASTATQAAQPANPFEAFWGGLSHVFGGGNSQAAPPAAGQPPPETSSSVPLVMKNGQWVPQGQ